MAAVLVLARWALPSPVVSLLVPSTLTFRCDLSATTVPLRQLMPRSVLRNRNIDTVKIFAADCWLRTKLTTTFKERAHEKVARSRCYAGNYAWVDRFELGVDAVIR